MNQLLAVTRFCSECQEKDQKSRVYSAGPVFSIVAPTETYWDEDGLHHVHNIPTTLNFICSRGHRFSEPGDHRGCPQVHCEWNRKFQ